MSFKLSQYPLTIREQHLDTFGHVNNAIYLQLYEEARWQLITDGGWGLARIQQEKKGPVVLDLKLDFKAELRNRENIVIKTRFKEMKNKLVFTIEQWMEKEDGKVASTLELSIGIMDLSERRLIIPPADWMKAIS
jgi:acyl-CoA thioester hydrolase